MGGTLEHRVAQRGKECAQRHPQQRQRQRRHRQIHAQQDERHHDEIAQRRQQRQFAVIGDDGGQRGQLRRQRRTQKRAKVAPGAFEQRRGPQRTLRRAQAVDAQKRGQRGRQAEHARAGAEGKHETGVVQIQRLPDQKQQKRQRQPRERIRRPTRGLPRAQRRVHEDGAHHRRRHAHQHPVKHHRRQGQPKGPAPGQKQPQQLHYRHGQQRDVQAGDGKHVGDARAVEALAQIRVHVPTVAQHQRAHDVGAVGKEGVDALAHGGAQAVQPRLKAPRLAENGGVRPLRRGVGGHAVAPEVGGKVELTGVGRRVRRPEMPGCLHALPGCERPQRGNIAAQIEAYVVPQRFALHEDVCKAAGEPRDLCIDHRCIGHCAGKGHRKAILQFRLRPHGHVHARRAEKEGKGDQQGRAAAAAQVRQAPRQQRYGGADQKHALRQAAVPRQKRAEAVEQGGEHQRPRVQRPQRQGRAAGAHVRRGSAPRGEPVPRRDTPRGPRRAATAGRKGG